MTEITYVSTEKATAPHGHYSQAVVHNDIVYVCGLLGNSREGHINAQRDVLTQAKNCLDDLEEILKASRASLNTVLKLSIYIANIDQWPEVNQLCAARFGNHKPSRIVVPALTMRYGSEIEVDAIAAVDGSL